MRRPLLFSLSAALLASVPLGGAACDSRPIAPIDREDARAAPPGTDASAEDGAAEPEDASADAEGAGEADAGNDAEAAGDAADDAS
ncbi:MAG: hypothetical protein KF795_20475 [Labilithrix sp.]|nr:hypothetical protein [Labilithrix sp.]